MLIREVKRLVFFIAPLLLLAFLGLRLYHNEPIPLQHKVSEWISKAFPADEGVRNGVQSATQNGAQTAQNGVHTDVQTVVQPIDLAPESPKPDTPVLDTPMPALPDAPGVPDIPGVLDMPSVPDVPDVPDVQLPPFNPSLSDDSHFEIYSVSRLDRTFFEIKFGDTAAINPNIIPHPLLPDTWIIVAQKQHSDVKGSVWVAELVCNAVFKDDVLQCTAPPTILPIAATMGDKCHGDLSFLALNIGPHDARVFYGPKAPYTIYGSNSGFTCFGQWIQDFRVLVDWGFEKLVNREFRIGTELQRPTYSPVEKNWFVFWDKADRMHVHYDVAPTRSFSKLEYDGSVGPDLAPMAAFNDEKCMAAYMPVPGPEHESVHQATNSLSITMCKRSDPTCQPDDSNTFVFTIFQHKTYYNYHSLYEPYVMASYRREPYEVYGISQKPFWVHGRKKSGQIRTVGAVTVDDPDMFYITSMSWKRQGQKYHGYMDDELFLSFGIEDSRSGGIDILGGDLFENLGLCSSVP